jgi:PAS domain S-box-containing protein
MVKTSWGRPWDEHDAATLLQALEVHQAELEVQNGELRAANEELNRTIESLAIAFERFRALYEHAPTPYVTVEVAGTIVDVNRAAEAMFATPRERLLGGTIDVFIDDAGRGRFRTFLETVFVDGRGRASDVLVRAESARVDTLIDAVVLRAHPHDAPRCVLAFVDITARKRAENARRQAQDEMLAIVSHDLRGPINAIGLACDALSSGLGPEDHRICVDAIGRAAARCERLIKDLLGVAHLESGRMSISPGHFDMSDLIGRVCIDHAAAVAAIGSSLTAWGVDHPHPMVGDQDRLHQALSNLISNALVHARGAAISIGIMARGDQVVIIVSDDGPGIDREELPFVFERYRQGARHHGGAGLGLAIVTGVILAHHGTVNVTSERGHGVRFEIVLPRRGMVDASGDVMSTEMTGESHPSLIKQVYSRRDELTVALTHVAKDDAATRAEIETALGSLVPMLTGDNEHLPDMVSRDLVRWLDVNKRVSVTAEAPLTAKPVDAAPAAPVSVASAPVAVDAASAPAKPVVTVTPGSSS